MTMIGPDAAEGIDGPYDPLAEQAMRITSADVVFLMVLGGVAGSNWVQLQDPLKNESRPAACVKLADELDKASKALREWAARQVS